MTTEATWTSHRDRASTGTRSRRSFVRTVGFVPMLFVVVLALGDPALAHGDIAAAEPSRGADLRRVPQEVSITFTETPTQGASSLMIRDGCGNDVAAEPSLSGRTLTSAVGESRPGRWRVRYRMLSQEDGHLSAGSYTFRVRGKRRCAVAAAQPDPGSDGETARQPDAEAEGGGSMTLIAIGVASLVLIALALVLRRNVGSGR